MHIHRERERESCVDFAGAMGSDLRFDPSASASSSLHHQNQHPPTSVRASPIQYSDVSYEAVMIRFSGFKSSFEIRSDLFHGWATRMICEEIETGFVLLSDQATGVAAMADSQPES